MSVCGIVGRVSLTNHSLVVHDNVITDCTYQ